MKSWLAKIPLVLCLVLSAVVLMMWVRTYFIGDRYRWVSSRDQASGLTYRIAYLNTGMGGISLFTESNSPATDPYSVARIRNFLATSSNARAGYRAQGSPRYPITIRDTDDSLLSSLGMRFSENTNFNEAWQVEVNRAEIALPFWAIFGLMAIYPIGHYVTGVIRRQRLEQVSQNCCPRCGAISSPGSITCICCELPLALPGEI
jgi:hypothetical protein